MKRIIHDLIEFHFNPCLLGTKYLEKGIVYKIRDKDLKYMELYEKIAKDFNTNYKCVEKNIRKAIRYGFDNTTPDLVEKFLLNFRSNHYNHNVLDFKDYEKNSIFIELFSLYIQNTVFSLIF